MRLVGDGPGHPGTNVLARESRPVSARGLWDWRVAIAAWADDARSGQRPAPETTIKTRVEHLQLLAKGIGVGPWDVTGEQLVAWFSGRDWKPNTYRSRRTTYRAFYAWAVAAGHVSTSPAHSVPAGEVPEPDPRPVPDRHVWTALAMATPRERLMIELAGDYGMRRAEVAVVWPENDLYEDLTGWTLIAHGKGGKVRHLPLEDDTAARLRRLGPGYAFPGRDNGHLSPRWVGTLISRLLPEDYTMHKLRHRAGTQWHDETGDIAVVQDLLGHADPKTTRAYVKSNARRKRAAVEGARRAAMDRRHGTR